MEIKYSRKFEKAFSKLSLKNKIRVNRAINLFLEDPFAPSLRNHALGGTLRGQRSLSAGYDLRVIFKEYDGYVIVVLINVGTHDQVY
ncbi:type II toxin-antitoxin system RelE/ParE family toxin [Magnetococcales bacterium HHB-1]